MRLAFTYAKREWRAGTRGFRIFLACLAIGVAAIAGAGSLSKAVRAGLDADARQLLGGDASLALSHRPASAKQLAALREQGAVSETIEMRAMAIAPDGKRSLVEMKGIDRFYPLFGQLVLEPPMGGDLLAFKDGAWGAAVDANLLARLGLALGGRVKVGDIQVELRAIVQREPDRIASPFVLGPRLLIDLAAVGETGLVQPGSLIRYLYRLALNPGVEPTGWAGELERRFPDAGWRIQLPDEAAPGFKRFLGNMTLFLTLVGLTALLVGGVGVANAVASHIEGRIRTIAMLKCLGAPGRLIFSVYAIQILGLAAMGIAIGLLASLAIPPIGAALLGEDLPTKARLGLYPGALALAALFGLLIALVFGLWPLARARDIPPAALLRDLVQKGRRWPRWPYLTALGLAAIGLGWLTIATAADRYLASWFVGVAAISLALFRLMAWGLSRFSRRAAAWLATRPGHPALRQALANLHRPGTPAASVVVSLGLGLAVLVTLAQIEGNMRRQLEQRLPEEAPAFFFIDIQADQAEGFRQTAETAGATEVKMSATVRGRLVALKGQPVEKARIAPGAQWAIQGDRAFTAQARPPEDSRIVAGTWWKADYAGPPLVSIDANLAKGMGLQVGDSLTVNILGRLIEARIASLREIDWGSVTMNFAFVFTPATVAGAPHTYLATAKAPPALEDDIERAVTDRFANVSAIRVRQAIDSVKDVLKASGAALGLTATITIAAGGLVLAGAVAAGHRRRVYEAVVLKVLGATRRDLMLAHLVEFGLIGIATGILAGVIGTLAAWGILEGLMRMEWVFRPLATITTVVFCILATLAAGFAATWRALSAKAAPYLRNE
ncbi:MAG: FtsX-like permease family protein [Rhodospirillales bacterium]|nr:FtsX-like permease family protein [Rhodospirillales bacterium]